MSGFIQSGRFASAWSPLLLSHALWLDASDAATITSSGGAVSQWDDKSGNTNTFSQSNGTYKPTTGATTLNGHNVVDFAAPNHMNTGTTPTIGQPFTLLFVARNTTPTTGGHGRVFCQGYQLQACHSDGSSGYRTAIVYAGGADFAKGPADAYSTSVWGVSSFVVNGASTTAYVNGTAGSAYNAGSWTLNGASWRLGDRGDDVVYGLTGSIAELLLFPSALSGADRAAAESYLNTKWAVY